MIEDYWGGECMDSEKEKLSIATAKLYYESNYSQQQICDKLGISRPTVSRLLQYAKDQGYVQIEVINPFENVDHLAEDLKEKFQLDKVFVTFAPVDKYSEIVKSITTCAAEYLDEIVNDADIIGVSWGATLNALATKINNKNVSGVQVVQLKGGMSHSKTQTHAIETVNLFARAYYSTPNYLHLPVVFDRKEVKDVVSEDRHIQRIMQLGRDANVAVFTVGSAEPDSLLFNLGYFNKEETANIQEKAVGDLCSRFIDVKGDICDETVNDRTVGIELKDLKVKEQSILVAGGNHKVEAICAALRGKYANVLVIDQFTAKKILAHCER